MSLAFVHLRILRSGTVLRTPSSRSPPGVIELSLLSVCLAFYYTVNLPLNDHKLCCLTITSRLLFSVILVHPAPDTRIIRGHRLPISRYRDKLLATYRGQIAVLKIVDFFTTSAFLSPSKSRKSQATKCRAFKTNSVLNKHRISKNQWTANSL